MLIEQKIDRIKNSFAVQTNNQTCAAAAIRHGLLLGGLTMPSVLLETMLNIRTNGYADGVMVRMLLVNLGLEPVYLEKPKEQSTAKFLELMEPHLATGSFLLPCIYEGMHWICAGAYKHGKLWGVDSYVNNKRLGFFGWTPKQLDKRQWEDCVNLVRLGRWVKQYRKWLPYRDQLLRIGEER